MKISPVWRIGHPSLLVILLGITGCSDGSMPNLISQGKNKSSKSTSQVESVDQSVKRVGSSTLGGVAETGDQV